MTMAEKIDKVRELLKRAEELERKCINRRDELNRHIAQLQAHRRTLEDALKTLLEEERQQQVEWDALVQHVKCYNETHGTNIVIERTFE